MGAVNYLTRLFEEFYGAMRIPHQSNSWQEVRVEAVLCWTIPSPEHAFTQQALTLLPTSPSTPLLGSGLCYEHLCMLMPPI